MHVIYNKKYIHTDIGICGILDLNNHVTVLIHNVLVKILFIFIFTSDTFFVRCTVSRQDLLLVFILLVVNDKLFNR